MYNLAFGEATKPAKEAISHTRRATYSSKGNNGKHGLWVFIPLDQESPQRPYDRCTFGAAPAPVASAEDETDIILPIITDGYEPQEEWGTDEIDVVESEYDFIAIQ